MLDICNQNRRRVEIVLLDRVVASDCEQGCPRAVHSQRSDIFDSGNVLKGDVFRLYVPRRRRPGKSA
jgi:hypothetical protein